MISSEVFNSRISKAVAAGGLATLALTACSGSSHANKSAEFDTSRTTVSAPKAPHTNETSSSSVANAAFRQGYRHFGNYINEVNDIRYEIDTGATNDALNRIIADGCFDTANGPKVTNVYGNPAEDDISSATKQQQHTYRSFLAAEYAQLRPVYHAGFNSPDMHDATQPTFQAEMKGCPPNAWDYRSDVAYATLQVLPNHPEG